MKKLTLFLLSFLLIQTSYSQEDTLLMYYRSKALNYQQNIKIAEKQLSSSENKLESSKSAQLPQLDFKGNYSYYGVPLQLAPPSEGVPGEELHTFYGLYAEIYQPILTGGNLKNTKLVNMSEVEMMKSYVSMNKQQVMLSADLAYWKAVSKKEMYRLYTVYQEVIGKFLKVIQDRVDEEIAGKNELYQTKVRYNDAEYKAIRAKKEYEVSIMELNRLIGLPVNTPTNVSDSLIVVNWVKANGNLSDSALNSRPEMNYLKNQISKFEYSEKVVGSKYNPQLGIVAGGKWGSPSPGLNIDPDFNYYIKANLVIPIFHWGQKNEEIMTIREQTEASRLQMEQTKEKIVLEVESSYYKLERSQNQLDFSKSSLDNAAKNVALMLDRYNEGLSSVLEVLDAQLYWQKTYMNYILAKYELNIAYSQYLYSVGTFSNLSK